MSTSTVSITPNPTSRRRPLHSTDAAAADIDLIGSEARNSRNINLGNENGIHAVDNGVKGSRLASSVLDRSKDPVSPRKSKRGAKRLWRSAVSIVVKNLVLLVVLLGFVQLIYRLAVRHVGGGGDGVEVGRIGSGAVVELEGRMADIERAWKRTVKMMQVQVEVVDAKLGNRVNGLREEMSKRIEETSVVLEDELRKLDAKVETLESELGRLNLDKVLTKEEFETFHEKLKNAGSGDKQFSLDDVRDYAKEVVETEIQKHAADGLGLVDYALASGGGSVVKHSEPFGVEKGSLRKMIKLGRSEVHQDAEKMLTPSFGEPGQCFPLTGSSGFVQIRLRTAILPDAFTLEHVAKVCLTSTLLSFNSHVAIYSFLSFLSPIMFII